MTILATHFAIVLGAWRLRIRIDIDEPRAEQLQDDSVPVRREADSRVTAPSAIDYPGFAPWGRG